MVRSFHLTGTILTFEQARSRPLAVRVVNRLFFRCFRQELLGQRYTTLSI
jgi:hypothetical protein